MAVIGSDIRALQEIGEIEKDYIDVIASGYEWICPHCEHFNKEIELNDTMVCSGCYKTFPVNDYYHAYRH